MIAIWPQEFFIGKRFEALLGVLCACWALAVRVCPESG